jgi:uncharacterized protein YyaL (SSP411 family)
MGNLLAGEASAYLRSAAHQPVHWLPWGDAAFARARAEDKPILLDIGAVWCHWCHVMDGESYDDPGVAEILNRDFVCVKVDRDERPDVDARYQRAVSAISGQGGWPLTAFLTPDGDVFFGGTYFPPDDGLQGRPGFATVLRHVARLYREQPAKVRTNAQAIRDHIGTALDDARPGAMTDETVDLAVGQMARIFDVRYGGFGTAPKFPHPGALELVLARWWDARLDWQRELVERTLTGMARGGIRDHLGGGFHRYAVDERWIVPHFEKMSYDNAELLRAYTATYAAFGLPLCREVATGIVDWVLAVLSDPVRGVFYTSQDADVAGGDDGNYWTWTLDEARAVLSPDELDVARRVYDLEPSGEMHHDPARNVLWWRRDPAGDDEWPLLRRAARALKAARDRRPAPFVDTTAYVNWNAMLAGAFLQAGAVLDRPECNELALRVLTGVWETAWDPARGMSHVIGRPEPDGLLDDNVQAAAAFLDAYEATGDAPWLDRAVAVMRRCMAAHWDEAAGGFFDLPRDHRGAAYLAAPAKPAQDAPTPSPNGTAALVLARLWALTDAGEWRAALDRQLAAFAGAAGALSLYGAALLRAADWALRPVTRITVAGPRGPGAACDMHLVALQTYRPRKVVVRTTADAPSATVCVGTTCSLPVVTRDALAEQLA